MSVGTALLHPFLIHGNYAAGALILFALGLLVPQFRPRGLDRRALLLMVPWLLLPVPAMILALVDSLHLMCGRVHQVGPTLASLHTASLCFAALVAGGVFANAVPNGRIVAVFSTLAWSVTASWQSGLFFEMTENPAACEGGVVWPGPAGWP